MIKLQNPIQTLEDIFNRFYPDVECEVVFVTGLHDETGAWGETCWPDDGGLPIIQVEVDIPFQGFIEVVAHELAHVVAGPKVEHGQEWEDIVYRLRDEFHKAQEEAPCAEK